jgi:hypothetical protein
MAKTWSQTAREHDKDRKRQSRAKEQKARKRRAQRRREWIDSPAKTAIRQLFGRR